jgi:hypothetical protein
MLIGFTVASLLAASVAGCSMRMGRPMSSGN